MTNTCRTRKVPFEGPAAELLALAGELDGLVSRMTQLSRQMSDDFDVFSRRMVDGHFPPSSNIVGDAASLAADLATLHALTATFSRMFFVITGVAAADAAKA